VKLALVLCAVSSVAYAQPDPLGDKLAPDDKPADAKPTDDKPADAKPADAKPANGTMLSKIDTKKIEQLFDEGTKHYDLGEWDKAIASFKQAYALMPDPSFLFNLGQAYKQKGACRDASAAYVAYLRKAPDEDRAKVEGFIKELEPCARIEDEKARRLLPPPRLSPTHRKLRIAGLATAGAGMLALGGAVIFVVQSRNAENDLEACATREMGCQLGEAREIDSKGRKAERNAKALAIAGGSAIAVGAALVFYTVFRAEYVTATPAPGGAVFSARMRF
jgi:tetratricopeptide (TPR) repeat protein